MNARAQDLVTHSDNVPATAQAESSALMTLIERAASDTSYDAAKLEKLLELKERWDANEARKLYMQAVADFKRNPPVVIKDLLNKQYGSKYTSLANMVNTTNESLSAFGLNARWDFNQKGGMVTVTCILSHSAGHSERVTLSGPPDKSGSKNPIQEVKSTLTYLKLATFEGVTGIASRDGNADDDGNGAGKGQARITSEQASNLQALLEEVGADKAKFLKYLKVESLESIPAQAYHDAVVALERKRK